MDSLGGNLKGKWVGPEWNKYGGWWFDAAAGISRKETKTEIRRGAVVGEVAVAAAGVDIPITSVSAGGRAFLGGGAREGQQVGVASGGATPALHVAVHAGEPRVRAPAVHAVPAAPAPVVPAQQAEPAEAQEEAQPPPPPPPVSRGEGLLQVAQGGRRRMRLRSPGPPAAVPVEAGPRVHRHCRRLLQCHLPMWFQDQNMIRLYLSIYASHIYKLKNKDYTYIDIHIYSERERSEI
ncbi:hypothetical protein DM860_012658 [Cuscuta australis]|uniref:Uncharacterized protein n=1 Tax=Cuscuta australis TaxID=267555 RepID=A0A328DCF2_9ASTE|nr:hypothetical protein DM860_012658 [Cuscuta australis]